MGKLTEDLLPPFNLLSQRLLTFRMWWSLCPTLWANCSQKMAHMRIYLVVGVPPTPFWSFAGKTTYSRKPACRPTFHLRKTYCSCFMHSKSHLFAWDCFPRIKICSLWCVADFLLHGGCSNEHLSLGIRSLGPPTKGGSWSRFSCPDANCPDKH